MDIDWRTLWNKQTLYPEMAEELLRLAYVTHKFLLEVANGGIVRTISRTQAVWAKFQEVKFELSNTFMSSLISKEETKSIEAAAKREHKFNSNVDASVEIFKLGAQYWNNVYLALAKESVLSYGDLEFIHSIAKYIASAILPTISQCKRLMKIISKAEDKGFIMP